MKKTLALVLTFILLTLCTSGPAEETGVIRLGALKGATSMGLVRLLSDAEEGSTRVGYDFTMAASADELTPLFLKGELDVIAVPANLASVLYNKTEGQVRFLAVNALGLIDIVEKGGETVQSIADLKGRTIYATGKGSTPEYALSYLLSQNGLTLGKDVNVEWKSETAETLAALNTYDEAIAMIPQPFATVAMGQVEGLRIALDLTKEWEALDNGSRFITAGFAVRAAFAEEHPELIDAFLAEYEASAAWVNENPAEAGVLIEGYGIVKAAVAEKALPYCNITCLSGAEMKEALSGYLRVLFDLEPASVGGALPGDDFFLVTE